ncbi:MAG: hypothetical protein ACR2MO_00925 [Acidimicrobiales bacterium]
MIRRALSVGVLCTSALAMGAAPGFATGTPGTGGTTVLVAGTVQVNQKTVCKSVFVLAGSTPQVTVTIGGKPRTIDTSAFVSGEVKICVQIGADAAVVITATVDTSDPLCPIGANVTGNIHVDASVNGGGVFVQVQGISKDVKPLTVDTEKLHLLPAGAAADVPLLIDVCDP